MDSKRKSLLGSVMRKWSQKGPNQNTTSNMSSHNASERLTSAPALVPFPNAQAPPPSYSEATAKPINTAQVPITNRPASSSPSDASRISVASLSTPEDPYAFLSTFDTVFVIDDSGSMAGPSWHEVKKALRAITPICTAHDDDGVDVYFLNAKNPASQDGVGGWKNIRSAEQVESLFNHVRPGGGTPIGTRINQIMKSYLRAYEQAIAANGDPDNSGVKPVNMIVITDGVPTDDPESVIVSIAKRLDKANAPPYQVGIQFFQVGNERGAAEALQELDDSLADKAGGLRDMVDTVTWSSRAEQNLTANGVLKVVLGAVVRRLDRKCASGES